MLRRSLQNYAKVKASSQASRGSSEYASCKENVPVLGDGNFMAVPQTASNQPGCDRTPTSRLDQKEAAVLSSQSSKGLAEVALTPMSASGSVDSTRGTPVLFANKNSLSMFGSPALISRDQEQASNGENIKVVIRVRPLQIKGTASEECLRLSGSKHVTLLVGSDDTTFTFDHVAGPQTTQEQFFRVVGRPMVENVLSGYNSCIFAYGQTGSGKTHTMLGQLSRLASGDTMPEEAGLIPRIFAYLFACIEDVQSKQREGREVCFLCKCSFLEIYNEVITDLFNPAVTRLHIREGLQQGVHVEGLLEQTVTSAQAVLRLLCDGAQNRHVAATKANADSSRSHCVFTCVVESKCIEDGVTSMKTSCLNLVDLAGSERQKVAEGKGERVKEAGSINRSLASLGLVIKKLVEGNGPGAPATQQTHIPYQDSRLTFLLQDSLGGNAKTVMVANVNPAAACLKETHSTLGFAHRARMIRNKAVVNEDTTADALLLQKENERLRKELEMYRHLQQACTPTPQRESPLVVAKVRQEAELAEAEVAAAWAGQLATPQHSARVFFQLPKMQVQCQSIVSQLVPATKKVASRNARALPARSRAFSSHSTGFTTGQVLCARPVQRASSRSRPQAARSDVFFTQKTVPDQTGRVAIVTGSSSGMGFEVAKCLSQKNATVIIAARNKQKCEKAAAEIKAQGGKGRIEAMELDLTSFKSIKAFADKYHELNLPLHMLINNAGVFLVNHDHTQEGFETTVGTNYFGHYYLTHLLLDKLVQTQKEGGMARAVFMSSTFEQLGNINWDDLEMYKSQESGLFEYATAKIMKLMLSRELNKRLKGTGVEMYSAQPGLVSSPLYSKGDHRKGTMLAVEFFQSFYGQAPVRGCRSLLRAATDPELIGRGGQYFSPPYLSVLTFHINNAGRFFPYHKSSRNEEHWKRLYDRTLDIVNGKLKEKNLPVISAV